MHGFIYTKINSPFHRCKGAPHLSWCPGSKKPTPPLPVYSSHSPYVRDRVLSKGLGCLLKYESPCISLLSSQTSRALNTSTFSPPVISASLNGPLNVSMPPHTLPPSPPPPPGSVVFTQLASQSACGSVARLPLTL